MSYQSEHYAQALAEFGTPRWLPSSRGWVLQRELPADTGHDGTRSPRIDARGCYPLFSCANPSGLGADLIELRAAGLVSLTLVTDPLADFDSTQLAAWFRPLARPYKQHYLVNLSRPVVQTASAHHQRNVRKFQRRGRVEVCHRSAGELDRWTALYDGLIARHGITGIARFSRESFRRQLELPGVTWLRAVADTGELAGMQIWFSDTEHAWYHLGASSALGYRLGGTSAALTAFALEHFRQKGLRWANLGSGAGLNHDAGDGLSRFKQGWATDTRWAWLCGAILDKQAYMKACRRAGQRTAASERASTDDFFPAYRTGSHAVDPHHRETVHGHAD